ncbi:Hypothetical protein Ccan_22940 [Capnocytophaga canimorsus Cc5]|uniref:Uncharacterized protein n=1 Tax=Capnocytophaga canimorsus (strain 5) TaxID=860228 RepID=F9YVH5_CAPCC|nr:Hypothetical protein Ccan_22940 [Capnocytophaga canimorsus Cc5]
MFFYRDTNININIDNANNRKIKRGSLIIGLAMFDIFSKNKENALILSVLKFKN